MDQVLLFGYERGETMRGLGGWRIPGIVLLSGLYFWGYWIRGKKLLWIVAAIALFGVLSSPTNRGASVYFVYAAAFIASTGDTGFAVRMLPLVLVVIGLETVVFHLPPYFWIPATVFSTLIGSINIHFRQRDPANKKLLMAQEAVEHLAKAADRHRIARHLHDT